MAEVRHLLIITPIIEIMGQLFSRWWLLPSYAHLWPNHPGFRSQPGQILPLPDRGKAVQNISHYISSLTMAILRLEILEIVQLLCHLWGFITTLRLGVSSFSFSFFLLVVYLNDWSSIAAMGCLTPAIVNMFKVILMLVIFAIILCFIGFLLDVLGTKSRLSLTVRSNGLMTIPIGIIHLALSL